MDQIGEVGPTGDAELLVRVREMDRDGLHRDEQGLCDLAVRKALSGEFGDAALAGRQRVQARENAPARACACAA